VSEEILWKEQEITSSLEEQLRLVWDRSFQTRRTWQTNESETVTARSYEPAAQIVRLLREAIEQAPRAQRWWEETRGAHAGGRGICL